jgi:hypothetical protein
MASVDRAKFWSAWRHLLQSGNRCAGAPNAWRWPV